MPTLSDHVFCNSFIVKNILRLLTFEGLNILDNVHLRLINPSFNLAVLSLIKEQHTEVIISQLPEEEEDEDLCTGFIMNEKRIMINWAFKFFLFLNNCAKIEIKSINFKNFHSENRVIHDLTMPLLRPHVNSVRSFKGAGDICEECVYCGAMARSSLTYGPVQLNVKFLKRKHFESLTLTEVFLADVAENCCSQPHIDAFNWALNNYLSPNITCDHLEIILSDTMHYTQEPTVLTRELIDQILLKWKVKRVTLTFGHEYSTPADKSPLDDCDYLTKFEFTQPFKNTRKADNYLAFERVEINLLNAYSFGKSYFNHMREKPWESHQFQNLIPNVMRIFPSKEFLVCLPLHLKTVVLPGYDTFLETMMEFAWSDVLNCRHTNIYFRAHTVEMDQEVMPSSIRNFTNRQIEARVPVTYQTMNKFFQWPLPFTTPAFGRSMISFEDVFNKSWIHLDLLIPRQMKIERDMNDGSDGSQKRAHEEEEADVAKRMVNDEE